jgi:hypothetical protein
MPPACLLPASPVSSGWVVWWVNRSGAQRLWKGGKSGERWGQLVPPWPVLGDAEMIHFILSGALRRAVRWK